MAGAGGGAVAVLENTPLAPISSVAPASSKRAETARTRPGSAAMAGAGGAAAAALAAPTARRHTISTKPEARIINGRTTCWKPEVADHGPPYSTTPKQPDAEPMPRIKP